MRRVALSASAWSADLSDLGRSLSEAGPYCDAIHFDVMDGHYVSNLLFGPDQVRAVREQVAVPFEGHFMVASPERICPLFFDVCDTFIIHRETADDWSALRSRLREHGKRVGLAVRVEEDVDRYVDDLDTVDVLLVMGTPLGVKGYNLDPRTPAVVRQLRTLVDRGGLSTVIQVDGGIRDHVVPGLVAAGADGLTPGSLFFGSDYTALRDWIDGLAADRRADEGANLAAC